MRNIMMLKILSLFYLNLFGVSLDNQLIPASHFEKSDMSINLINDQHIQREQLKLKKQFQRNSLLKNGLTISALSGAGVMLYWWSTNNLKPALHNDQKAFLQWFDELKSEQKYDALMNRSKEADILSITSLFRKLVPYVVGSAATSLINNSLQIILMQPLSRAVNKLYFQVELSWFISTRSNILELFNALESLESLIAKNTDQYHINFFTDMANDMIFQIERILAFMYYQLDELDSPNRRVRSIGLRATRRIRDVSHETVMHLNEFISGNGALSLTYSLKRLRSEFDTAVKQFKVFESACN